MHKKATFLSKRPPKVVVMRKYLVSKGPKVTVMYKHFSLKGPPNFTAF